MTEIQWSTDDALPFPVCISSTIAGAEDTETQLTNVSVVLGNVHPRGQRAHDAGRRSGYRSRSNHLLCAQPKCGPLHTAGEDSAAGALPADLGGQSGDAICDVADHGSPSTPDAIPLSATSPVSLKDGNGFITMQVAADSPATWPQYFGVVATASATPGEFDLAVVFDPQPGGPAGISGPVTLEFFAGMNLTTASSNYAGTVLANSQFISVPAGPPPSSAVPTSFPTNPTLLPNTGTLTLDDSASTPYLTIQPTNPMGWPPLFSVISQQQVVHPTQFNLLLLYTPPSGPEGVTPPVIVEQFLDLSLATTTTEIASASDLISAETFEGEPNPSLSVADLMQFDAKQAIPAITVTSTTPGSSNPPVTWTAVA